MLKVVLYGVGSSYQKFKEINSSLIDIVALVDTYQVGKYIDGYIVKNIEQVTEMNIEYDYIIICSEYSSEIRKLLLQKNIDEDKIINYFGYHNILNLLKIKENRNIIGNDITIISNHCWGAYLYKTLGIQYNSPFIWLSVEDNDYKKLVSNFNEYMDNVNSLEVIFDEKLGYPVGTLKDIKLQFIHYKTCDEAYEKFISRTLKINKDNILLECTTSNKNIIETILASSFEKKLIITDIEYKSNNVYSFTEWKEIARNKNISKFSDFVLNCSFDYIDLNKIINN